MRFRNREEAGRRLAAALTGRVPNDALVLALPRGGVPVAVEVARALGLSCEVLVSRKLGAPGQPELGMGAIAEGGAVWVDRGLVRRLGVPIATLDEIARREEHEIERRVRMYRGGRPLPSLRGRTVVIVDDGIAMGGTMRAAIKSVRSQGARAVVVAVPVAPADTFAELRGEVDDAVAVLLPEDLMGVGLWYADFPQTSDEEVVQALAEFRGGQEMPVRIELAGLELPGDLVVPPGASGIVVFAHGSGSSRRSVRNRQVAKSLQGAGLATLLFDLLTEPEEARDRFTGELRFDIALLSHRLVGVVEWVHRQPWAAALPIGLFGSSTGAAAALIAAALRPRLVHAVVSRGGRADLAGQFLRGVSAPTLLIVGGADSEVLELNEGALEQLQCEKRLEVVPRATHLFEERGALEQVSWLAGSWFSTHLRAAREAAQASP